MAAAGVRLRNSLADQAVATRSRERSHTPALLAERRGVNRGDFQELAELHLQHGEALLDAKLYSGAYYMCGYAVECALKACICKNTAQFDFYPHPRKVVENAWSHDFTKLVGVAGLQDQFRLARNTDAVLHVNWNEIDGWSEDSRHESKKGSQAAENLITAVSDPDHGVLACIKRYW